MVMLSDPELQERLKKVDKLLEDILDKLWRARAAERAFSNEGAWAMLLESKGIPRGSLISVTLREATLSYTILTLARLWDSYKPPKPKKPPENKVAFPDLVTGLLNKKTLVALLKRAVNRYWAKSSIPGEYSLEIKLCFKARREIRELYDQCFLEFHGHSDGATFDPNSNPVIKRVRDKWISHNDVDFEGEDLTEIERHVGSLLGRTMLLSERLNYLIRDADFKWETVDAPIKRDLQKMFEVDPDAIFRE